MNAVNLPAAVASPQPCENPGYPVRSLYYRDEVREAVADAVERCAAVADGAAALTRDQCELVHPMQEPNLRAVAVLIDSIAAKIRRTIEIQ